MNALAIPRDSDQGRVLLDEGRGMVRWVVDREGVAGHRVLTVLNG